MMNKQFDEWFWEIEGFDIRAERFWDDINNNRRQEIYQWLQSAYEMGYNAGKQQYGGTE